MPNRTDGGSPLSQFAPVTVPCLDTELEPSQPLIFWDQSAGAGPSTPRAFTNVGEAENGSASADLEENRAPERRAKKKKKGWKGWAVVTQDENGNLIEVGDEVPEGVPIKPLRAPASATLKVDQKAGQAPRSAATNGNHISTGEDDMEQDEIIVVDEPPVTVTDHSRHPRRAAALASSTNPQASSSRHNSPAARSATPVTALASKKRQRPSEAAALVPKSTHRPAGRGASLPSTQASKASMAETASPNLRKTIGVGSVPPNAQPATKLKLIIRGSCNGKGKGKEPERRVSVEPPLTGSSSRHTSSPTTNSQPDEFDTPMAESDTDLPPDDANPLEPPPLLPLRLGMGDAQSAPAVSQERSRTKPAPRPCSPPTKRWRALPPEPEIQDGLLYVPAVDPDEERQAEPHFAYAQSRRPTQRTPSAFELEHGLGFSGVSEAMERDAQGFMNNVKTNLAAMLAYTCPHPSAARTAFIEHLGRGLQEIGWNMTDQGEL